MESLIEKLSSYNLFNYLFPGAVFYIAGQLYLDFPAQNSLVDSLFIFYFTGLVISRIGSLVIQPALRKLKILNFADYALFLEATQKDPKLDVLSEQNNMYRTLFTTFVVLGAAKLITLLFNAFPALDEYQSHMAVITLLCIFLFAFRKQTQMIHDRIKSMTKEK